MTAVQKNLILLDTQKWRKELWNFLDLLRPGQKKLKIGPKYNCWWSWFSTQEEQDENDCEEHLTMILYEQIQETLKKMIATVTPSDYLTFSTKATIEFSMLAKNNTFSRPKRLEPHLLIVQARGGVTQNISWLKPHGNGLRRNINDQEMIPNISLSV